MTFGMGLSDLLLEARDSYGHQRFYPYGEHPATQRLRDQLKRLEELRRNGGTVDLLNTVLHVERKIAEVEVGEYEAKLAYLESCAKGKVEE